MTEFEPVPDSERGNYAEDAFEWQVPPPSARGLDFTQLGLVLDVARSSVPPEVQSHFTSFVREGLLTVRAVIDWSLERLDAPRDSAPVEDVPIE